MTKIALAAAVVFLAGFTLAGQEPPRDTRAPRAGTAVISGIVLSDETQPKPLRRAHVTLGSGELPAARTAITNDEGAFTFERLPAGRYTVAASKDAYVTMHYGAARAQRPGTAIVVREGETQQIALRLPRGAVITGTIVDPDGQPASGISVSAVAYKYEPQAGERRLGPVGVKLATSDDRGAYRIYGLAPGDYFVSTTPMRPIGPPVGELRLLSPAEIRSALAEVRDRQTRRGAAPAVAAAQPTEPSRSVAYANVFYPGTPIAAQAVPIHVGRGEERAGVDFQLQYAATARVEGHVVSAQPGVRPVMVTIAPSDQGAGTQSFDFRRSTSAGPDGRFSLSGVQPGRYTVIARGTVPRPGPAGTPMSAAPALWAFTEIAVDGQDISDVMLTLQPGLTIAGRVVFEGTRPRPADLTKLRVNLPFAMTNFGASLALGPVQLDPEGRFTIEGIAPATYRIGMAVVQGLRAPIGGWWLKSLTIDGREVLDTPLDLRQSSDSAVATFSDRASELSGTVRDAHGNPASEYTVIVFSVQPASWFASSRRVAGFRLSRDGYYAISNLPPGEYFITATTDVEPNEWFDPALLQRLAAGAPRMTLGEYERKVHDVVVK